MIPCISGYDPDNKLLCTVHVTAGNTVSIFLVSPVCEILNMFGVRFSEICFLSKPTISITIICLAINV
jgi:hypothetical protein